MQRKGKKKTTFPESEETPGKIIPPVQRAQKEEGQFSPSLSPWQGEVRGHHAAEGGTEAAFQPSAGIKALGFPPGQENGPSTKCCVLAGL